MSLFSRGNFSGGSGDGPDDSSGTGKQEGGDDVVGVFWPKESKPKSCPQPSSEQGQADDSYNQRHDHTFLVRDQSTSASRIRTGDGGFAIKQIAWLLPVPSLQTDSCQAAELL